MHEKRPCIRDRSFTTLVATGLLILSPVTVAGCGTTQGQKGATSGAAIGALASGVLGGSVLGGAIVGGGLGYIIGNEEDKKASEEQATRERAALADSRLTDDASTTYQPTRRNDLTGSTWQVLSLTTDDALDDWASMVVTFQTNSKVTTLVVYANGEVDTVVESYRLVDDILVFSGKDANGNEYVVDTKISIENGQMIMVATDFRAVLREVEENA